MRITYKPYDTVFEKHLFRSVFDPRGQQYSSNILIMPDGSIAPRTQDNLSLLLKYVENTFKKRYTDKRTKAYKYMKKHDSEFKL